MSWNNYVLKARDYIHVCCCVHIMNKIMNTALIIVLRAIYGNNGYIIFQSSKEDCKSASPCFLNEQGERFDKNKEGKWNARYHNDSTILNNKVNYFEGNLWWFTVQASSKLTPYAAFACWEEKERIIMSVVFGYFAMQLWYKNQMKTRLTRFSSSILALMKE